MPALDRIHQGPESAQAGLAVASPGLVGWYERNLARTINHARWMEYSLSASIMVVLIAMLTGITDLYALIGLFVVNAAMILFGWLMEHVNEGRDEPYDLGSGYGHVAISVEARRERVDEVECAAFVAVVLPLPAADRLVGRVAMRNRDPARDLSQQRFDRLDVDLPGPGLDLPAQQRVALSERVPDEGVHPRRPVRLLRLQRSWEACERAHSRLSPPLPHRPPT